MLCKKAIIGVIEVLSFLYKKPFTLNNLFLLQKIFNPEMEEGNFIAEHINKFKLISVGKNCDAINIF